MMTSEQIQQLRRDEAAMMAEWSASSVQPRCFNTDGIVDYELWSALPDGKHIVVLLKETNGLHGSLVEPKSVLDDMVRNIAVVNLKKCPGGAIASSKAVRQAARQDADRLKRQIQLYEPDIILTGGWGLVSNILHDEIFADDAEWIRPNEETALWYYKSSLVCTGKETLVVSMPHPNRAAKNWTLELEKVLRATGRL